MKKNLLFLGNDGNLLSRMLQFDCVKLAGVVADKTSKAEERCFGSSFSIGKRLKVPVIPQKDFNRNYKNYLKGRFKHVDIIFVHGYHYRIKRDIIENEKIKTVNFHQSLLPKYGGRHPLNWAIIKGENTTGITFHHINEEIDGGDIIFQKKIRVSRDDDVISLYGKTIKCASKYIKGVIESVYDASFIPVKQDIKKREYFSPRGPDDGEILECDTVKETRNKVRALVFPYPGAFVRLNGRKIVIDDFRRIRGGKGYDRIDFAGRHNDDIILRVQDGLLKVTKIRK